MLSSLSFILNPILKSTRAIPLQPIKKIQKSNFKILKRSMSSYMYPTIEPFHTGTLKVSELHTLYYEQSGNKVGLPVVFLHGGPGGNVNVNDRRYFDPTVYRIILFDQRGCGKSTPAFSLIENNTWTLVSDMEKLRWVIFGGSWGSTLALVYAQTHIQHVLALILRGIFLFEEYELKWTFQSGASNFFPDRWESYLEPIPKPEHDDLPSAYHRRLTGNDEKEKLACAKSWSAWEMSISRLRVDENLVNKATDVTWALAHSRIECHYFRNRGFLKPNHILSQAHVIENAKIPVTIIHGRYDVVCPIKSAWELYKKLSNADFHVVEDAGHSAKEEGTAKLLVQACDNYKDLSF